MGAFEDAKAKLNSEPKDYGDTDVSRAKASDTLIHPSFPTMGTPQPSHLGSQSKANPNE